MLLLLIFVFFLTAMKLLLLLHLIMPIEQRDQVDHLLNNCEIMIIGISKHANCVLKVQMRLEIFSAVSSHVINKILVFIEAKRMKIETSEAIWIQNSNITTIKMQKSKNKKKNKITNAQFHCKLFSIERTIQRPSRDIHQADSAWAYVRFLHERRKKKNE